MLHRCAYYAVHPENLLAALRRRGHEVDQSTLSRDLTELGIRKIGGRYVLRPAGEPATSQVDHAASVRRFTTCGPNLIVVSTGVGAAQPVALAIDGAGDASIAATLAGDDTIFIATGSRRTQTVALRRLKQWFGDKHEH
jgi:transcriptional regulator of arginine metabolism